MKGKAEKFSILYFQQFVCGKRFHFCTLALDVNRGGGT